MKLKIVKNLENGVYALSIEASDFSAEEKIKISKFGSPQISILPKEIERRYLPALNALPVHSINHTFYFDTEENADNFAKAITERVKTAMETLRKKEDGFSGQNEYEL